MALLDIIVALYVKVATQLCPLQSRGCIIFGKKNVDSLKLTKKK